MILRCTRFFWLWYCWTQLVSRFGGFLRWFSGACMGWLSVVKVLLAGNLEPDGVNCLKTEICFICQNHLKSKNCNYLAIFLTKFRLATFSNGNSIESHIDQAQIFSGLKNSSALTFICQHFQPTRSFLSFRSFRTLLLAFGIAWLSQSSERPQLRHSSKRLL